VVTYIARNLEPYRGFPSFMRALPHLLAARPAARVVIVGGDEVSYGQSAPDGQTWRARMLAEIGPLDPARVHLLGRLGYRQYLSLLQVSAAHVYLTVPFVLSWSCMEALAAGCAVIGSRTPPVREVIEHGRNGWLVDFLDPPAIAAQVVAVLADRAGQAPIRARARETVLARYALADCLAAQLRLVRSLV
jgi:glycosyltransferase involved in cell wall biosynthesis